RATDCRSHARFDRRTLTNLEDSVPPRLISLVCQYLLDVEFGQIELQLIAHSTKQVEVSLPAPVHPVVDHLEVAVLSGLAGFGEWLKAEDGTPHQQQPRIRAVQDPAEAWEFVYQGSFRRDRDCVHLRLNRGLSGS